MLDVYWIIPMMAACVGAVIGFLAMAMLCAAGRADRIMEGWRRDGD